MKKLIYPALSLLLILLSSSCEELLDLHSPDSLTVDKYYRDETDALKSLAAAYGSLDSGIDMWSYAEVKLPVEEYRHDLIVPGNDATNYLTWMQIYYFTNTSGNSQITSYWESNYLGIYKSNQTIEGVESISEEDIDADVKQTILGEAYFLRAWYHLSLQMRWQQIVVRDEAATSETLNKALSPRSESWDFIISDLETAASMMLSEQPSTQVGRATKNAAYAYLGFAWLQRASEDSEGNIVSSPDGDMLQEAITALGKVSGINLVDDFASMFDGTNENSEEVILERQFTGDTSVYWLVHSLNGFIPSSCFGGWDEMYITQKYYDFLTAEFDDSKPVGQKYDKRTYATMFFDCPYYQDPENLPYGYGATFSEATASETRTPVSSFAKLLDREPNNNWYAYNNVPLMRLANVMLMKAEAEYMLSGSEDWDTIDEIRSTHGGMDAADRTQGFMAALEHERVMEFGLENSRFFDLRRWNRLSETSIDGVRTYSSSALYFPTPEVEVNANSLID
ncbi:MAG: RagB/SusD family nutrient uptake outer membrane protein [Rikenellaceae bacterium]